MHKYNLRSNKTNVDDNLVSTPENTPNERLEDLIKSTRRRTDELRRDFYNSLNKSRINQFMQPDFSGSFIATPSKVDKQPKVPSVPDQVSQSLVPDQVSQSLVPDQVSQSLVPDQVSSQIPSRTADSDKVVPLPRSDTLLNDQEVYGEEAQSSEDEFETIAKRTTSQFDPIGVARSSPVEFKPLPSRTGE